MGLLFGFATLVLAAAEPSGTVCTPISGWDKVLADERVRWIVIGEIHGNNQTPEIFADAVCLTTQVREDVVVALEMPSRDQASIERFMASDGGEDAQRELLEGPFWNGPIKDGRSSEAYFRLLRTLRDLREAGRIASVVAFQPSSPSASPGEYEKAMASLVRSAAVPGGTVIALVGNVHAMRTEVPRQGGYLPMAAYLPTEATVTLNAAGEGGETWACSGQPIICGPMSNGRYDQARARAVELSTDGRGPYSGTLYLGTATTPSPPQLQLPTTPS